MMADAPIRCEVCAARTHAEWLATLKAEDVVLVRNGALHFRANITATTRTLIRVGKLTFRSKDGYLIGKQRRRIPRMRIVRDHQELR